MIATKRSVPLVAPVIGDDEIAAVTRVLRTGQLAQGPEVAAFEQAFAGTTGTRHAIALNSGTAAIHAALEAIGVADGDEVITTPFTFAATASPILMQRALPRFVDIDSRTFNLDLDAALAAAGARTKAVVAVDLFGLPFRTSGLTLLHKRGIRVVADACQAAGARRDGISVGARTDVAAFSFYATKNIMTGEGGMLTTDDSAIAAAARRFRQHGEGARYEYLSLGFNYRMTDLLAAIGRVQLGRLADLTCARQANAAFYDDALAGLEGVTTPLVPSGVEHAYHQYSILIDPQRTRNGADRDRVRASLAQVGVGSGIYYPTPLHLNPLFARCGYGRGDFPIAEQVASQVLSLPVHPLVDREQREAVVIGLRDAVGV